MTIAITWAGVWSVMKWICVFGLGASVGMLLMGMAARRALLRGMNW